MDDRVRAFYDALAPGYDRIFADWRASVRRQAGVLGALIARALGPGPLDILDAAAGIGTQAIGLATLGHRVHATDLSAAAIARLADEAASFEVALTRGVADLRALETQVAGEFDVVLAMDNALPHLLTDADLELAVRQMAGKLRPGGLFLVSLRDYDQLVTDRPTGELPRVVDEPEGRRISFQVWDWAADGRTYRLHQFLIRQNVDNWWTEHAEVDYRALLRAELETAVSAAGLVSPAWLEPAESGFYQPILIAWKRR
ncbi:MAG: class I SAM-dependent methyltransferase [Thermomicrobiales bacterium]|nr:class I SAM-dependent methyltransferase [Thermomicrobiales bacterium]